MRDAHTAPPPSAPTASVDLDTLRTFAATIRLGSFSRAAADLGLSQPAVSRRIRQLERALGVDLLQRSRPAVTPTRQGLALLEFAERTLTAWDGMLPSLSGRPALEGSLHIAASTTPAECVLPALLGDFCRLYPDVRLDVATMNSDAVEAAVRARHCNVGLLGRAPRNPHLRAMELFSDEVLLALPAFHHLARSESVGLEDLAGEAFIAREAGSGTWDAVRQALSARGAELPPHRVVARVSSPQAVLEAVAGGHGISFVPAITLRRIAPGRIVPLRLRDLSIRRPIVLLYEDRPLNPCTGAFVRFVRSRLPLDSGLSGER